MTLLPLSPSRLLPLPLETYLRSITPPSQDSSPKLTFLTRTECPPKFPQASCHQSLTPNPYRGLWPIDRTMTLTSGACLADILTSSPSVFSHPCVTFPTLAFGAPQRAAQRSGFAISNPTGWRSRSMKSVPG